MRVKEPNYKHIYYKTKLDRLASQQQHQHTANINQCYICSMYRCAQAQSWGGSVCWCPVALLHPQDQYGCRGLHLRPYVPRLVTAASWRDHKQDDQGMCLFMPCCCRAGPRSS
jgi:hypothetical protein